MADTSTLFLELLQVAVGNRACLSRTPSDSEWGVLYALAEKHTLTGICFSALECLHNQEQMPPMDLLMDWLGQAEYIRSRNDQVNQRCEEVQQYVSKAGFRSCILKGQCAARYYGELASLRQSGDIDLWLEGGRKRIMDFIQRTYPTKAVIMQHAHFPIFEDVEVEAHFSPSELQSPLHNRRLQKWIREQEASELQFVESGFTGPSAKFDAVFMLSHIYKHLMSEGIGLRQVLDYYFMLKSAEFSDSEKEEMLRLMKQFGMKRFAGSIMWVILQVFEPNGHPSWLLCEPDEKDGKLVMAEIMDSGNFGHLDSRRDRTRNIIGRLLEPRILTWKLAKTHPLEYLFTPINRVKQKIWMMVHGYIANE